MKLNHAFSKHGMLWFLLAISTLFILLRFPSFFEPLWYGDEGIYQVVGSSLNQGRLLYTEIWDNKPPFLYFLYAIFGSDQFSTRVVSALFGAGSAILFFWIITKLFQEYSHRFAKHLIYGLTIFYVFLFGTPLLEGNIANAENFMLLPILGGALLMYSSISKRQRIAHSKFSLPNSQLLLTGFLLGIAFLFKIVAIFDTAAFYLFIYLSTARKNNIDVQAIKSTLPFIVGFSLPVLGAVLYFLATGTFLDFTRSVFFQMFGYVSHGNRLLIPQGLLVLKLVLLGASVVFIYARRNVLSLPTQFILLWFFFSLFNAFFAQRPYTHYLLVLLPGFLLFVGLVFLEKKYQTYFYMLLAISLIIIFSSFSLNGKTYRYYQNFLSFVSSKRDIESYRNFFDRKTEQNYQVASYIKSHTTKDDSVFLWGNSAQMYILMGKIPPGRFAVAYHMTTTKNTLLETQAALAKTRPKFVIVESINEFPPFNLTGYVQKIQIQNSLIYERSL